MKRTQAFHHTPEEIPGPAYYPLSDLELQQLRAEFRANTDHYITMSILRRIEQGIQGMRTTAPTSGPVFEGAKMAVNWFAAWCKAEDGSAQARDLHEQLRIILAIQTPELALAAA